ncbi:hypothetical protein KY348_00800 [Candidatus Woesearchaeota archaeon]|nr:hypothetical protein [Candidatus Woesearchaeota archaeon]
MTSQLFNSNNLEEVVAEITENFNDFYAKPVKKAAEKVKEFVFNPKAYGWSLCYAPFFGAWAYYNNRHEPPEVLIPGTIFRTAASVFLGRQVIRGSQLISKKIKNPWVAYPVAMLAPYSAWAVTVYSTMYAMGMERIVPSIAADLITLPFALWGPIYCERNNIELHLGRDAVNYVKKKLKRNTNYQKL